MYTDTKKLPLAISPSSVVEDDGATIFTIRALGDTSGAPAFDGRSCPRFNGTTPALSAPVVVASDGNSLSFELDTNDLGGAGDVAVTVINIDTGRVEGDGATVAVAAAEEPEE